jgi:hypothetical protein
VTDIPSSSTPPMFQAHPGTFDTSVEDQLDRDEIQYDNILASIQADDLAASQLTQPPPVLTQPSQLAAGGTTMASRSTMCGGASPAGGGATPAGRATPDVAGSSQAAMATSSPDQLGPRVVRAPDPWTYDRDQT